MAREPVRDFFCFAIVIGNEGNGISSELLAACDGSVVIPMVPGTESLNAAAASTVLLWELLKNGL